MLPIQPPLSLIKGGRMPLDYEVRFLKAAEKGQDAAEYAILIALIAIVIIAAVALVGTNLSSLYVAIVAAFP